VEGFFETFEDKVELLATKMILHELDAFGAN
jgi:hypothetical protein